jgi:nucleoid-associated protein YgaU
LLAQRAIIIAQADYAYSHATTDEQRQAIIDGLAAAIHTNDQALALNHCPPAPTPPLLEQTQTSSAATLSAPAPVTHVVQPGETLSSIARTMLGNANLYPQIFAANQGVLANPNLIHPGQILVIPTT